MFLRVDAYQRWHNASGVAKGGRGGATAPPPMVPKTVLVKSLNPGRNFRGGVDVLNNESNPIIKLQKHIDEQFACVL